MSPKVAAIVVSCNSESTLERCIIDLEAQAYPFDTIVLVDSGSTDQAYLLGLKRKYSFQLLMVKNLGFSRANNLGFEILPSDIEFVLFCNPDLFLPPDFVGKVLRVCEENPAIALVSGKLLGYDVELDSPSGKIDSTGVLRKWYGRWYDRGQGEIDKKQYDKPQLMAALCGALLFCRNSALQSLPGPVFDPDFFLYKEDIELSMRMRRSGWKLLYHPKLVAYHCRGWATERNEMPLELRIQAAKSELLLYKKHPSPYMLWALFKYFLVKVFRL